MNSAKFAGSEANLSQAVWNRLRRWGGQTHLQGNAMGMHSKIRLAGWALCVFAGISAFAAGAQTPGPVTLSTRVYQDVKSTDAQGKATTKRQTAKTVVPGDEVVYEITYSNSAKSAASDVVIDNPGPAELTFVSVEGNPAPAFSVDGGKTFGKLADLSVRKPDGTTRPARPDDVNSLRWVVATIAPGGSGKVVYHAQVK